MKTFNASFAFAIVVTVATGCNAPTAPGDPRGAYHKTVPYQIDPTIPTIDLPRLEPIDPAIGLTFPQLSINVRNSPNYRFIFTASAGGNSSSASMLALRSLRSVTVQVYSANGRLIDSRMTTDIPVSGVMNAATHEASLTTMALIEWKGYAGVGSYVVMIVRSTRGQYSKQVNFPIVYLPDSALPSVDDPVAIPTLTGTCRSCLSTDNAAHVSRSRSSESNR